MNSLFLLFTIHHRHTYTYSVSLHHLQSPNPARGTWDKGGSKGGNARSREALAQQGQLNEWKVRWQYELSSPGQLARCGPFLPAC